MPNDADDPAAPGVWRLAGWLGIVASAVALGGCGDHTIACALSEIPIFGGLQRRAVVTPPAPRAPATEPTVDQTEPPDIAALARRYQPELVVARADRFWPVSIDTLIRLRSGASSTCIASTARSGCTPLTSTSQLYSESVKGR